MLKQVSPRYDIIVSEAMESTDVITSVPTNIGYKDTYALQLVWTGDPVGSFSIQGSVNYNPGLPQTNGPASAGTWDELPIVDQDGIDLIASGSAGSNLIDLDQRSFPWIRVVYTNASGDGLLTATIYAKSFG